MHVNPDGFRYRLRLLVPSQISAQVADAMRKGRVSPEEAVAALHLLGGMLGRCGGLRQQLAGGYATHLARVVGEQPEGYGSGLKYSQS